MSRERPPLLVACVLAYVVNVVSLVASALVMSKLARLPPNLRFRSTPRLMRCLALSDLIMHADGMVFWVFIFLSRFPDGGEDPITMVSFFGGTAMIFSICLELAVAIAYLLRSIRRGLRLLPWLRLAALALGTSITICKLCFAPISALAPDASQLIEAITGFVAATLSVTCYVVVACRAQRCGDTVAKRHMRRAGAWVANALLTNLAMAIPKLVLFLQPHQAHALQWFLFSCCTMAPNGALNSCTVFWLSRYSNETIDDIGGRLEDPAGSFDVRLGDEEIIH